MWAMYLRRSASTGLTLLASPFGDCSFFSQHICRNFQNFPGKIVVREADRKARQVGVQARHRTASTIRTQTHTKKRARKSTATTTRIRKGRRKRGKKWTRHGQRPSSSMGPFQPKPPTTVHLDATGEEEWEHGHSQHTCTQNTRPHERTLKHSTHVTHLHPRHRILPTTTRKKAARHGPAADKLFATQLALFGFAQY